MKKILSVLSLLLVITNCYSQHVKIDSTIYHINHGELTFYLDKDANSYVSVHSVTYSNILKITGERSDKWHREPPYGPYNKEFYIHSGYDLGHLTPSNITSYIDSTNYNSFSMFNQAPQLAGFNRGKWAKLEAKVVHTIKDSKKNAIVITGVIYDNVKKKYLQTSKIKIPLMYYKILITSNSTFCWVGSNVNGELIVTDLKTILDIARKNKNPLNITITN